MVSSSFNYIRNKYLYTDKRTGLLPVMVASPSALGCHESVLVGTCRFITMNISMSLTNKFYSPVNAMAVSMIFTIILTCIAIGSEVAYGIFVSLNVSGLVTSYIICISCKL